MALDSLIIKILSRDFSIADVIIAAPRVTKLYKNIVVLNFYLNVSKCQKAAYISIYQ